MPKSTPNPTKQNRKCDREQVQRPTIHSPAAVVIGQADKEVEKHRGDDLRGMQRHPENQQHHQHGAIPLRIAPSATVAKFFVGNRNRPGQPHPRAEFTGRLRSWAACLMASVASLPGSSALKSRIGLNSMKDAIGRRSAACR